MTQLTYQIDDAGSKLWLVASFEAQATPIVLDTITNLFKESEFANFYYDEEKAKDAVALINEKVTKTSADKEFRHVIAEKRGAKIKIKLSADKMTASAEVICPFGGNALTAKQIIRCLSQVGVTMGIDQTAVKELATAIEEGEPGQTVVKELAKGKYPVKGEDSTFESLTKNARDRILVPQETGAAGKVDMRDLGELISVKQGAELMRRHPPTLGKPGFTVQGDTLQPEPGKEIAFEVGEGVKISDSDPNLLISEMAGLPYVLEQGMRVDNVLMLTGVNITTGHIDFEGGVVVNGDVAEGMRLKASGDVTITGFVENADIDVEGDLTVASGIVGRRTDEIEGDALPEFHCNVKAKGIVAAKYIQYVNVETQSEVHVSAQLMHSKVQAKKVRGGHDKNIGGKIVGGWFEVEQSVECATIGAAASTHTHISLFPHYRSLQTKLISVNKLVDEKQLVVADIKLAWKHLQKLPDDGSKAELLAKTKANYNEHNKLLKRLLHAQTKLNKQIEEGLAAAKVVTTQKMYANTKVKLGKMNCHTERDYDALTVKYSEGKLLKVG
ncbi:hypothetical protein C2869_14850 [Saccharobesus litoralis]|uniref:Flagellar Assembly Protein A N-terminal region domain-containing protein n=1 Tax=Saccharobesus litoralis TaxID=2172099 RepID=A0A2S0VTV0_9ALTE|nr:FapA family protein [Saccharobesus litoralis]AWB67635.1 hypothetical protein C2869_14850 [Saccharobesus litoralis]